MLRRIAKPLVLIGLAQWIAQIFWWVQDGIWVAISFGRMRAELFGYPPFVPVPGLKQAVDVVMALSPGTAFLVLGVGIMAWGLVSEISRERRNRRLLRATRAAQAANDKERWTRVDFRNAS